jgi:hypothetical protein
MPRVLVRGGVSYNLMIYLDSFPAPTPQTVASQGFHETELGRCLRGVDLGR